MALTSEQEAALLAFLSDYDTNKKKISDLESAVEAEGDMLLPIEKSAATKNISVDDIKDYVSKYFTNNNLLINPEFAIDQRNAGASTAISDDTYCFDRWYALTQTASINVSQQTLQEDGQAINILLTQNQSSAQRMGLAQIIEAKDSQPLRAAILTLAARVKISNSQALRYAVLEWTGTADAVTSDVVLDWTSSSYVAGGFFLASNLNVLATGSLTPSAATWTDLTALNATVGSSANNIIILIWTEATAAQNVTLGIGKAKLEKGSTKTPFIPRLIQQELALCQRYCYLMGSHAWRFDSASNAITGMFALFPTVMRATPTATIVSVNYFLNI